MAKENEDSGAEDGEKSGGKSKLIILLVVGLLLIGLSAGGTYAALTLLKDEPEPTMAEEGAEAEPAPAEKSAIYYPLKPEYILNIDARGRRRFLKLDLTVLTRDDDVVTAIETHKASIDNAVNLIGGGQIFEEIQTPEGKEFLRLQLTQEIQSILTREIGKPGIEHVLFTNFVMQ